MTPIIYSLGTSNRSWQEFVDLIRQFQIDAIVDVRRFPTSSRFPHFKREYLTEHLAKIHVAYHWLGETLGGFRKGGYVNHMKTDLFQSGLTQLEAIARARQTAFICRERFPWRCHRRFIAIALEQRGWSVRHILNPDRVWIPSRQSNPPLLNP